MRVIQLGEHEGQAGERFGIYYTTAYGGAGPKSLTEARTLEGLQDALDAVSHARPVVRDGQKVDDRQVLDEGVTEIRLEDAHWSLLQERIFGGGIQWLPGVTRQLTDAYDAIDAAAKETA